MSGRTRSAENTTLAKRADFAARHSIARVADRCTVRGSFARAAIVHALDFAASGQRVSQRSLSRSLGLLTSTMVSRALRAGIDIRGLLDCVRHVRIAAILEDPRISVTIAAEVTTASSPQSLARHIRRFEGLTPSEWRQCVNGKQALAKLERVLTENAEQYARFALSPIHHRLSLPAPICPRCAQSAAA